MEEPQFKAWEGFVPGKCNNGGAVNLRDFGQRNYTPYDGGGDFLECPTKATTELWDMVCELSKKEREAGGVLDMDCLLYTSRCV